jgi:hypothetical protein
MAEASRETTLTGDLGLQVFVRPRTRQRNTKPKLTLIKGGTRIGLNHAALDRLDSPARIVYGFNRERRIVGVRPAKGGESNSYTLCKHGAGAAVVSARTFLRSLGIAPEKTVSLEAQWDEGHRFLYVEVPENLWKKGVSGEWTNEQ